MTDPVRPTEDRPKAETLTGHITAVENRHLRGVRYTLGEIRDSSGQPVTCIWKDSEGFELRPSEEYKVTGIIVTQDDKRVMHQPTITLVEPAKPLAATSAAPRFTPRTPSLGERIKEGIGGILTCLFWLGVVGLWIVGGTHSSSSSANTANTKAASPSTNYSSSVDDAGSSSSSSSSTKSSYDSSDDESDSSSYDSSYDSGDDNSYDSSADDYSSSSSYSGYTNTYGNYVPSPTYSGGSSVGGYSPSATCEDGTTSYSQNRSGTCSHHGGVSSWY